MGPVAAAIPAVLAVVGTAVQVYSSIQQGKAQSAALQSQAEAQELNAQKQAENAARIRRETALNEEDQRREASQQLGRQRAAQAQGGILGSESATAVAEHSANLAELDAMRIRYQGEVAARGLIQESAAQQDYAASSWSNASQASWGGYLGAGAAALSGLNAAYGYGKGTGNAKNNATNTRSTF